MTAVFFAFWGAVFAGIAVLLGAFGAHALRDTLDAYSRSIWEKAVFYHALHALGLLTLPALDQYLGDRSVSLTGAFFVAGIILFSGSLYLLAFTGRKALGAITPLGGVAFILGWSWLAVSLFRVAFRS